MEDESNCADNNNNNLNTYCESKFWITYYRNFKQARLAYEEIISDAVDKSKLLLSFGGPNGLLDSTNWDYFVQKYLTYWCPYRFGVYTHFMLDSNSLDNRKHIYLRDDSVSPATVNDDVFFPYLLNNVSGITKECDIREDNKGLGYLYVPYEFQTNCISRAFNPSPLGQTRTAQNTKHYMACWNDSYTGNIFYYSYLDKCKVGNRGFIVLQPANVQIGTPVSYVIQCQHSDDSGVVSNSYTKQFNELSNNDVMVKTSNFDSALSRTCTYSNTTGKAACNSKSVTCWVDSITPSYLDFVLTLTGGNTDNNPTSNSGTVSLSYTLTFRLNLPRDIVN